MSELSGKLLASAQDLSAYLFIEAERTSPHIRSRFDEIDSLTREFLALSLDEVKARYELPLGWINANNKDLWGLDPAIIVAKLSPANQEYLNKHFNGEAQLKQGAAWLDAIHEFSIPGLKYKRIAARLADNAGFLFYLSVAVPALETLLRFMDIRQGSPLLRTKEFQLEGKGDLKRYDARRANNAWFERTLAGYSKLGIEAGRFFGEVKSISHFFKLPAAKRHSLIEGFLDQIREGLTSNDLVQRLRAERIQTAVQAYYQLSGKNHKPVPRRRFLKKAHEWLLSGYFGGSWLQFLEYVQEESAEDDYISAAIPKPQVLVPLQVPSEMKELPVAERLRILDSLDPAGSGLRARYNLARDFWNELVKAHERQKPGMISLWGLIEDNMPYTPPGYRQGHDDGVYNPGLFRKRLPAELLQRIEGLYGRETALTYPTARTVSSTPYGTFCSHLNPALSFWHGVGLTIWFLTQGPYSRTDVPGMPHYYRRDLEGLAELGCPVDSTLFRDLSRIKITTRGGDITTITITLFSSAPSSSHTTRDHKQDKAAAHSFQQLKDVYLGHLRAWTENYFEKFWRGCYQQKVTECGQHYNRLRETKGKPPTPRQFVNQDVIKVINAYFSGDIYRLLEVLGEPLPRSATVRDGDLIPSFTGLERAATDFAKQKLKNADERLQIVFIEMIIRYCILWDGRGSPPKRTTFSSSYYYQELCKILGADPDQDPDRAWLKFSRTVEQAARPALNIKDI